MHSEDAEVRLALSDLQFTIENEVVHSVVDFLERRISRIFFDINAIGKLKQTVMQYLNGLKCA